jgi:hypothetical protein
MPVAIHTYVSVDELKGWLGLSGTAQDNNLTYALEAATNLIDEFCGRVFYVEKDSGTDVLQERYYDCEFQDFIEVDDISTTTGLIVQTLNADGSVNQTLVRDTDYYLAPYNADKMQPRMPFDKIYMAIENGGKILPTEHRRGLKVTGYFGFPIQSGSNHQPPAVTQACLIQSARFWQRKNSPMGFSGNPETGQAPVIFLSELDPDVKTMLKHYKKSTTTFASGRPYTGLTAINTNRQYGV